MFYLISFLWFIRTTKAFLFWLYLWQLKEYRFDRFLDHFRTDQGKKLFLNWLLVSKIILFLYALFLAFPKKPFPWQFYGLWIVILAIIYFFESLKFFLDFIKKRLKKPVITKKTSILILTALILEIFFLLLLFKELKRFYYWFSFSLLSFDILTPLIIFALVLFFHPLTTYQKNQIINKAIKKRQNFKNLLVIGITGSYGKTATKEFLAEILSQKYRVLKTKKHQNTEIGVSQCILNDLSSCVGNSIPSRDEHEPFYDDGSRRGIPRCSLAVGHLSCKERGPLCSDHQIFVVEMGAYKKGEIKLLCEIAKPKIGILTGINQQHLVLFGSQENIIKAKYELIESLPEDGLAIFNGNNQVCLRTLSKN